MDYRTALFCEFDRYAAESYCAVHGVDPTLNIGDITKADEIEKFTAPGCGIVHEDHEYQIPQIFGLGWIRLLKQCSQ